MILDVYILYIKYNRIVRPAVIFLLKNIREVSNNSLHKPSYIGSYLAGLWEGDGHIWIPVTTHAPSGKKYTPHFAISFAEEEYPLVLKLKSLIGGSIRHKVENHAYVLTITSISEIN